MKTRDKILSIALELFNTEGVAALSAVDIASAMGISAGHLYYHFKGKPEILVELMTRHREEVDLVLEAAREAVATGDISIESLWTHVHILTEEAWDARFFYREPALAAGQPDVAAHARHILAAQRNVLGEMLEALDAAGTITASPEVRDGLAGQLVTGIAFHMHTLELEGEHGPPRERIARAAAQIMIPVAGLAG